MAAHLRPAPPYDAGPEAARLGATAMIDVSDGLLADLGHVADASGVQVNVDSTSSARARRTAAAAKPRPDRARRSLASDPSRKPGHALTDSRRTLRVQAARSEWVLTGGEDHSLVAAFPPGRSLPDRWRVIGEVREGAGVTVDGAPHEGPGGWQHFR